MNWLNPRLQDTSKALAAAVRADGCTASPEFFYTECCNAHDVAYRTGVSVTGFPITRREADRQLYQCMHQLGHTPILGRWVIPWIYWTAVRLFGGFAWQEKRSISMREPG